MLKVNKKYANIKPYIICRCMVYKILKSKQLRKDKNKSKKSHKKLNKNEKKEVNKKVNKRIIKNTNLLQKKH